MHIKAFEFATNSMRIKVDVILTNQSGDTTRKVKRNICPNPPSVQLFPNHELCFTKTKNTHITINKIHSYNNADWYK